MALNAANPTNWIDVVKFWTAGGEWVGRLWLVQTHLLVSQRYPMYVLTQTQLAEEEANRPIEKRKTKTRTVSGCQWVLAGKKQKWVWALSHNLFLHVISNNIYLS